MFDPEFYPCSRAAWDAMNADCYGKTVLDPSAGIGTLLKFAQDAGAAHCIGIEKNPDLRFLLSKKFTTGGNDWFNIKSEDISHVDMILMNPPYSNADDHILHAWKVAAEGCEIIAQCNTETLDNDYGAKRKELKAVIRDYGVTENAGQVYKTAAERTTDVNVSIIRLFKPITTQNPDFEGFYHDLESGNEVGGVIKYNEIQAIVNTYTGAVRCFERFAEIGYELNGITRSLGFGNGFQFQASHGSNGITSKDDFAREFQKHCWKDVFKRFKLEKYLTSGVMRDVNKFVESRLNYPFTMKNIFRMVEIIVGTSEENLYKAVVEAVDNFTRHTHENRFSVEGWKTNSGSMLNRRFIVDYICNSRDKWDIANNKPLSINKWGGNFTNITDLTKALCFLTGKDFDQISDVTYCSASKDEDGNWIKEPHPYRNEVANVNKFEAGKWYEWEFFKFRLYKKGTAHFEFVNIDDWGKLNQAYSKAKGNPLPEEVWKGFKKRTKQAA